MPILRLITGPRAGTRWPVLGERFALGRDPRCELVLTEATSPAHKSDSISRRHALLTFIQGDWLIQDGDGQGRSSYNGTFVNDQRLQGGARHLLRNGDQIRLCNFLFVFEADIPTMFSLQTSVRSAESRFVLENQPAERLRMLLDVSIALRATLETETVLRITLEHLLKLFPQAERGLILLRENPSAPLMVRLTLAASGEPADPRFSTMVVGRCLENAEAVLGDDLPVQFPQSQSLEELPARTLMCVPLWGTDGQALGVVQLDRLGGRSRFTADDLHLLIGVASQASVALSNARLHQESLLHQKRALDLVIGQQVQLALLPSEMPHLHGYEFAAHYDAAQEVGGDAYDFVPLPGGRLAILLADVEGKGVPAGLVMAKFGVEARRCLEAEPDPSRAVAQLNNLFCRGGPGKFITMVLAVIDPGTQSVAVVSAGHPSPILLRASGEAEEVLTEDSTGFILGVMPETEYPCCRIDLAPGDLLLLYSDGISEAMDRQDRGFGVEGIRNALSQVRTAPETVQQLLEAVRGHAGDCDQSDDMTVVCFQRHGP